MGPLPPVAKVALAFSAGAAMARLGAIVTAAPLLLAVALLLPIRASRRPRSPWIWLAVGAAGFLSGVASGGDARCPAGDAAFFGHLLAAPLDGVAPLRVEGSRCEVRAVFGGGDAPVGRRLALRGEWREGIAGPWLRVREHRVAEAAPERRWAVVRWRARLVDRLHRLYPERAPLVSALILARREGLARETRDAFARVGIAHLLAISGFHVGVVAGIVLAVVRSFRLSRRRAAVLAAGIVWGYVAILGFPDAATRAALILTLVAISRAGGRPPARWGALGAAFLLLVALDPGRLAGPGFQLSFAGAAALIGWAPAIERSLRVATRGRAPRTARTAVAAGVAATLATLPIVAWHFERVSLVGIPATLAASPLVALAVPGAILSLAIDGLSATAGSFVAGGVDGLLVVLERGTLVLASREWTSVWLSPAEVTVAAVAAAAGASIARRKLLRGWPRRIAVAGWAGAGLVLWPMLASLAGRGTLELHFVDVGQGDAIAIRTPRARWILVDAGPPTRTSGARHPVVRALDARGVRRIERVVFTHPDLDHIGGGVDVLESFRVGRVADPGRPAASGPYLELLEAAGRLGVPWERAREGTVWTLDGVVFEVLAPGDSLVAGDTDTNASSVVLHLQWGRFDAILTGDAPVEVERTLSSDLTTGVELLKVGHHGSRTSTDPLLIERAGPELAVVSVGRGNRFGHPHPEVISRLVGAGVVLLRTDRDGSVGVVARRDGRWTARGARSKEEIDPSRR